jgi:hypothetical protein
MRALARKNIDESDGVRNRSNIFSPHVGKGVAPKGLTSTWGSFYMEGRP